MKARKGTSKGTNNFSTNKSGRGPRLYHRLKASRKVAIVGSTTTKTTTTITPTTTTISTKTTQSSQQKQQDRL